MDKITGLGFCAIAAYLYTAAYSAAAAYAPSITSWSHPTDSKWAVRFDMALEQTGGQSLLLWSTISLFLGIVFLAKGISVDIKNLRSTTMKRKEHLP